MDYRTAAATPIGANPTAALGPIAPPLSVGLEALTLSHAIRAFLDSGLMQLLEQHQPIGCDDLGRRAHVEIGPLQLVLDALACGGVVETDDREPIRRWRLTGTAAGWRTLVEAADISAFLDTGTGRSDADDLAQRSALGARYRDAVGVIASLAASVARRWAPELARPGIEVLEIGAGAAPWSRALLDVEPTTRVTIVDLPAVIDANGTALIDDFPDSSITLLAADVFGLELDRRYDLVVVSGFCRLYAPETNELLFTRIAGWLRGGGRIVILDAIRTVDGPAQALALYSLSLAARHERGRIYELADFACWLHRTGMGALAVHPTGHSASTVLIAAAAENHLPAPLDPATPTDYPQPDEVLEP